MAVLTDKPPMPNSIKTECHCFYLTSSDGVVKGDSKKSSYKQKVFAFSRLSLMVHNM